MASRSPDDRVGDLAEAIGLAPAPFLQLDGRQVACTDTLAGAGVVRGSRLDAGGSGQHTGAPVVVLVCEAGPASGPAVALPAGRHVVGRSPGAAVRIDDPSVEPHHVLVDVAPGGAVAVVQLTGRVPCRVDGEPIAGAADVIDGSTIESGRAASDSPDPATRTARRRRSRWR